MHQLPPARLSECDGTGAEEQVAVHRQGPCYGAYPVLLLFAGTKHVYVLFLLLFGNRLLLIHLYRLCSFTVACSGVWIDGYPFHLIMASVSHGPSCHVDHCCSIVTMVTPTLAQLVPFIIHSYEREDLFDS